MPTIKNKNYNPYKNLTVSKMKKHMSEFNRQLKQDIIKGFHKLNKADTTKIFKKHFEEAHNSFLPKDKYLKNLEEVIVHQKFKDIHTYSPRESWRKNTPKEDADQRKKYMTPLKRK